MYCTECGAKLPENGRFCENCGAPAPQENVPEQPAKINFNTAQQKNVIQPESFVQPERITRPQNPVWPAWQPKPASKPGVVSRGWDSIRARLCLETEYEDSDLQQARKQKFLGELKIFLCLIIPLAVLLIISIVCVQNQPVGVDNFVQVTFSGEDGYGTAQVSVNTTNFEVAYENRLKRHSKVELPILYSSYSEMFRDLCVSVSLDKTHNLSNGDTVTCHIYCDEELAKRLFGVDVVSGDRQYTVSGLK